MHTQSHKLWSGRLALASLALALGGCFTAVVGDGDVCLDAGYAVGEKYQDDCNWCTCMADGTSECTLIACDFDASVPGQTDAEVWLKPPGSYDGGYITWPDAGDASYPWWSDAGDAGYTRWPDAGDASYPWWSDAGDSGYVRPPDAGDAGYPWWLDAGDASNGPWWDAAVPADATVPPVCVYQGRSYQVGEGFLHSDNCNKCVCTAEGLIQCTSESCMTPSGCLLGDTRFDVGTQLVCADGCNTCSCGSKTDSSHWFATTAACPALPAIAPCPASASSSAFPAQFVYLANDALAVVDSRCVNGQTLDYGLCWESANLATGAADLYVFATGTQRACNAEQGQRVFSLEPLRQALIAAQPGTPRIKAGLRGSGRVIAYEVLVP